MAAALRQGLVIAHLGQGIAVEPEAGADLVLCQTRRKLDPVAAGDRVLWKQVAPGQGCIEDILPRRSLLARPASRGRERPVAANIDCVLIVFASEPPRDWLLIDQYLAVCENRKIEAALVFNKIDLPPPPALERELDLYQNLGYRLYRLSVKTGAGFDAFRQALKDKTGILAGQSGVGKTSITNALIPDKALKTNAVSAATRHGRHTTTTATLYHLPGGGNLIDSPGVSVFGLADLSASELGYGFREFQPLLGQCRFSDCRHIQDKDCAIRLAAERGGIQAVRYQRYLKLLEKMPNSAV